MTQEERHDIGRRLIRQQQILRDVFEACEAQAGMCKDVGANGMAFACLMVREILISYSKELNTCVVFPKTTYCL